MKYAKMLPANFYYLLVAFLISYYFFFFKPVFLNNNHEMQFFSYIPKLNPIGIDLQSTISFSSQWYDYNVSPYGSGYNCYPPLSTLCYLPFLHLSSASSYIIITSLTIISYLFITILFPLLLFKDNYLNRISLLIFLTGLYSYGFQLEIERGQINTLTFVFCLVAIYLYHYDARLKYLAYVLISIAIQLKIYPAIFILFFINNIHDWKNNLKRIIMLVLFNIALLFVLGISVANDFFYQVKVHIENPYTWVGNHSIKSFATLITKGTKASSIMTNHFIIECLLFLLVIICIIMILIVKNTSNDKLRKEININLLLGCTIAALLIPSISHDYTLPLLSGPIAVFYQSAIIRSGKIRYIIIQSINLFIIALMYCVTLYSFTNKGLLLGNNCPVLMIMLIVLTIFTILNARDDNNQEKIPLGEPRQEGENLSAS